MSMNNKRPKILVVDDIPINIELQKAYLSIAGYQVLEARDGEEALRRVKEDKPDLIILDIMMPKINGFEVCRRLKNDPQTCFIPVVMVTALKEMEDKIKGIEAGADDFISKPFNKTELLARVKSLLRIKFLHDELEEKRLELQRKVMELEEAQDRLQRLAITDGLTGLYNYRYFWEQLYQEVNRAKRHNLRVSLLMMDIDFFKHYNDAHGHPAGDDVLVTIAKLLKENIRKIDIPARYGGEEFSIILVETDKQAAHFVAEKIRALIEEYPFQYENGQPNGRLTVSIGVSTYPEDGDSADALVNKADQRLYRAKQEGKNKVISA